MNLTTENVLAETYFDNVPISKMFVAPYGRNTSPSIIAKLVKNFDIKAVGTVYLSYREDTDTYAVVDGQHRMLAATKCGYTTLPSRIYLGLTYEQEAILYTLFATVNKQMAVDRYRALIEAKDPKALEIKELVESFGLKIGQGNTESNINAIWIVYKIVDDSGLPFFGEILQLLTEAFETQTEAYTGPMLRGVAAFWTRYRNVVDRDRLIDTMRRRDAKTLLIKAKGTQGLLTQSESVFYVGVYILDEYNNGLRTKKLPAWKSRKYVTRIKEGTTNA